MIKYSVYNDFDLDKHKEIERLKKEQEELLKEINNNENI